jgi:dTDP-4-amino-4,6-dideoxygalactose transaminase
VALAPIPLNDLRRQLTAARGELLEVITQVLDSGWLVQGPQHAAFEKDLAAYLGAPYTLGVASGTDALELALRAVMPRGRSVVVTAANCGGYTTTAARRAGLTVRYADVDAETHLLSPSTLEPVLDASVGVVVVTHLYGRAADVPGIRALCEPLGIQVLEDCAQALGASLPEGRVGTLGDIAAFSFYPTKNLGAVGDGGAVATASLEVAERVRELRQYGWQGKYRIGRDGGRNSRLDELQAAVLRSRLPHLDGWNERRRAIVARYVAAAAPAVTVLPADGPGHVAHLGVVVTERRDALTAHLAGLGIKTDVHYPVPDHRQPAIAAEHGGTSLPVTERLAASVLSVPLFAELRDDEIDRVCVGLAEFRP